MYSTANSICYFSIFRSGLTVARVYYNYLKEKPDQIIAVSFGVLTAVSSGLTPSGEVEQVYRQLGGKYCFVLTMKTEEICSFEMSVSFYQT
jgi:hypothetical protein